MKNNEIYFTFITLAAVCIKKSNDYPNNTNIMHRKEIFSTI